MIHSQIVLNDYNSNSNVVMINVILYWNQLIMISRWYSDSFTVVILVVIILVIIVVVIVVIIVVIDDH